MTSQSETRKLLGKPIVDETRERDKARAARLAARDVIPALRVIRVGAKEDDLAYERRILSAAAAVGVNVSVREIQESAGTEALLRELDEANLADDVHGILLFRPLPAGFDERRAVSAIKPEKDVDGASELSMARLYEGKQATFFSPCTAESVLKILQYYQIEISGKRAVVVGRSAVIGKPVALLLLARDATVTIAHSRTKNLPELCREADILICAGGMTAAAADGGLRGGIGLEYLSEKQTVIDVGIHVDSDGGLFGDVDKTAANRPAALTPVPGGVGGVTTQILLTHVIDAAERF